MNKKRAVRSLVVHIACSLLLAIFVATGLVAPWSRWSTPLVLLLHKPLAATWYTLFPSQDSYPLYTPATLDLGFVVFVGFATAIYVTISYIPMFCAFLWRVTRSAVQTPAPFLAYAVAGAVLGGIGGFLLWASFTVSGSEVMMQRAVVAGGVTVGWMAAVIRCALERQRRMVS